MKKLLFIFTVALFCCIEGIAQKIMLPVEIETKDNVPENILYSTDFDKRGRGVNVQEYFDSYNSYIGVTFCCPQKMEVCEPVGDYASPEGFNSIAMMCMKSDDGEFELQLSMPMIRTKYQLSDFWKKACDSKLYYDAADRSKYIRIPGSPDVDRNIMHHLYIVRDGASNVVTRSGDYAHDMFNADTVKIYDAPTGKTKRIKNDGGEDNKYSHCKVMTIQKNGRGYFFAYCLFTDKAYKKAEKYIGTLKGMIRYSDDFTPSWKSYADIEDFASDEYEDAVEKSKWKHGIDITAPDGYKPYSQMAGNKKRVLLNLNSSESFGTCATTISADGNELLIYSVAGKDVVEMADKEKFNMINLIFKGLPGDFVNSMNISYPPDSDFRTTDSDGFVSCSGTTEKLGRFMFIEDCDDGNMRLTPLSEVYPHMTIKQKYSGKYRVRIYKFRK